MKNILKKDMNKNGSSNELSFLYYLIALLHNIQFYVMMHIDEGNFIQYKRNIQY